MRENFDDRDEEWLLMKNDNLILKLEGDKTVDDYDKANSIKTMPPHFECYILSHSERLMKVVIEQIGDIYNIKKIYYTDTNSLYIHKKY